MLSAASQLTAPASLHLNHVSTMTKICRRAAEKGSLASKVLSEPKYTENMFIFAVFPVTLSDCDFALSLCYHSDRRSQSEVTRASINNSLILADVPKVS